VLLRRLAVLLPLGLCACATITTSPSQDLAIATEPPGARCEVHRDGRFVGTLEATLGTLRIGKSSRDSVVTCTRPGHRPAQATLRPEFNPVTIGNVLLGGVVGIIVDASTGAVSRYPDSVQLVLEAEATPAEAPPVLPPLAEPPSS